jgi:hypothetical protein
VFPPQPASVTTEGAYGRLEWKASEGEDRYRRSLYTFSKRTAPFAMYATFDAPSGEACVARRDVSNTPLQALTLLNDGMFLETAQHLGRTFAADARPIEERMSDLFRRCLVRPPSDEELADLTDFYETQNQRFAANEANAKAILRRRRRLTFAEQAIWTAVARAMFNVDEFVTKN